MDLKPGRELDALIAEKVMGLRVVPHAGDFIVIYPTEEWDPLPWYSSEIADAWEVVEKITAGDRAMSLIFERGIWCCKANMEFEPTGHEHVAETAPLAICLAALKSIGVE